MSTKMTDAQVNGWITAQYEEAKRLCRESKILQDASKAAYLKSKSEYEKTNPLRSAEMDGRDIAGGWLLLMEGLKTDGFPTPPFSEEYFMWAISCVQDRGEVYVEAFIRGIKKKFASHAGENG